MTNDDWMTKLECPPQCHPERSGGQSRNPLELLSSFRRGDFSASLGMAAVYSLIYNLSLPVSSIEKLRSKRALQRQDRTGTHTPEDCRLGYIARARRSPRFLDRLRPLRRRR